MRLYNMYIYIDLCKCMHVCHINVNTSDTYIANIQYIDALYIYINQRFLMSA